MSRYRVEIARSRFRIWKLRAVLCSAVALVAATEAMADWRVTSPDRRVAVELSDAAGLKWAVSVDAAAVLTPSALGLEFKDKPSFGPGARIVGRRDEAIDQTWDNRFGPTRTVRDRCNQTYFTLDDAGRTFGVIVRVYDDGVAVRYDLPEASGLGEFVLTNELTEFAFAEDAECWAGEPSNCAENRYPRYEKLSQVPSRRKDNAPYLSVAPLVARTSKAAVAISESDVIDWAGMFVAPTGSQTVKVALAGREDGNGLVVSRVPRQSPWRVMMVAHKPEQLLGSQLVANLATPSKLKDDSWVKPGVSAWDPWWAGLNPNYPPEAKFTGVEARGDTTADKRYIDLAADMGWPYMLIDWYWYENMTTWRKTLYSEPNAARGDFTRHVPKMDLPELSRYAEEKGVRLLIWAHSLDVKTFGEEKAMDYFASLGVAGVKIDFINSQSQQTAQWVEKVLKLAADRKLAIDFHGFHHPTGLSRTYPNFLTQEGVLGNEYNKLGGNRNDPQHQLTLMFTRALIGPMDYTPGGFLNRDVAQFKVTSPAQAMGTRARQLALTVLFPSPLTVMCDAPANYKGQQGADFVRNLPSSWDDSVVLKADFGKDVAVARRSGDRWYVAAINIEADGLRLPLNFLPAGRFRLTAYADRPQSSDMTAVDITTTEVTSKTMLDAKLNRHGGFVATISPVTQSGRTP